ncbi:hypothetical protein SedNR2807_37300 [Citrobacter sedlakii]
MHLAGSATVSYNGVDYFSDNLFRLLICFSEKYSYASSSLLLVHRYSLLIPIIRKGTCGCENPTLD